jgi:hypothetical protein
MSPRITLLAVAACLPLLARAADCEGDLRDLVAIHPPGTAAGRLTFAGIGPASPSAEASAKFLNDRGLPRRFVADFGTELVVSFSGIRGGPTRELMLLYSGSAIAVRHVFDRWKEVLVGAGAECGDDSCLWWDEQGRAIAILQVEQAGAHVSLIR